MGARLATPCPPAWAQLVSVLACSPWLRSPLRPSLPVWFVLSLSPLSCSLSNRERITQTRVVGHGRDRQDRNRRGAGRAEGEARETAEAGQVLPAARPRFVLDGERTASGTRRRRGDRLVEVDKTASGRTATMGEETGGWWYVQSSKEHGERRENGRVIGWFDMRLTSFTR